MCVACGQELCKNCKGCHNVECERYTEPTSVCGSKIAHKLMSAIDSKAFLSIFVMLL